MRTLRTAALGVAFAAASTLGVLAGNVQHAPVAHAGFFQAGSIVALADNDEHENGNGNAQGNPDNCVNPAGHTRGWCKHGHESDSADCDNQGNNNGNCHRNKHKHHRKGAYGSNGTISGTVVSVSGTMATVRLDNGGTVNVNENGTALNVGQHYTLNGCYQGGVFVLGCYSNGNYPTGQNQQISGTILGVGNGTITLLGVPPVTINVQQAVNNNQTNGSLALGRHITAYGYYQNGTFYATSIQ